MTVHDRLVAAFAEDELLAPDAEEVLANIRGEIDGRAAGQGRLRTPLLSAVAVAVVLVAAVALAVTRNDSPNAGGFGATASTAAPRPSFHYRSSTSPGELIPAATRQRAEPFALPTLDGGRFVLVDHRGHVVVLTWSASWCAPCRVARDAARRVPSPRMAGVDTVTIATRDDRTGAAAFFGSGSTPYDLAGSSLRRLGGLPSVLPLTVLVDRDQRVAAVYAGTVSTGQLAAAVDRLRLEPAD